MKSQSFTAAIAKLTVWQATVEAPYQEGRRKLKPIVRLVRMGYEDASFRLGLFLDHEPIGEPTFTLFPGELAEEMQTGMTIIGQGLVAKMEEIYRKEWAPLPEAPALWRRG